VTSITSRREQKIFPTMEDLRNAVSKSARQIGPEYLKETRKTLRERGRRTTGKLARSLKFKQKITQNKYSIGGRLDVIAEAEYASFVEDGTPQVKKKYSSPPPFHRLMEWAIAKGKFGSDFQELKRFVLAVQKNIFLHGTTPKRDINDSIEAQSGNAEDILEKNVLEAFSV